MTTYNKQVRRKDRQEKDISFLRKQLIQSLACSIAIEREGHPLLHTAFFAYDEKAHSISFHFSRHGSAGSEITDGKKATVSIYRYGKLYTAEKAVDFGSEYESIILFGEVQILTEQPQKTHALDLLFQKFFSMVPVDSYKPFNAHEAREINVASIKIADWIGKAHHTPAFATDSFYHPLSPLI